MFFRRGFLYFTAAMAASIFLGIMPSIGLLKLLFQNFAYFFILVAFVIWIFLFFRIYYKKIKFFNYHHLSGLLLSILITVIIFIISPPQFKILSDETNLIGVSMMMFQDKETSLPIEGLYADYARPEYSKTIDKRPVLFPFLVSLIHTLSGYSPNNGFILNFILSIFSLFFLFLFFTRLFNPFFGMLSILILSSFPVYIMSITSSGFESLNMFFIIFSFFIMYEIFIRKDIRYIELLCATFVLLAQCRYESIIFLLLIPFFFRLPVKNEGSRYTFCIYIMPFLFVPVFWQRRIFLNMPEINKIGQVTFEKAEQIFSLTNLFQNFHDNIWVLLGLDPNLGFSPVIAILAIFGFYFILKRIFVTKEVDLPFKKLVASGGSSCVVLFGIITSFYWGNFKIPMDNRLALIFLPYIIFCTIFCIHTLFHKRRSAHLVLSIFFLFHLLIYWPYGIQQRIINGLSLQYEYGQVMAFLNEHYKKKQYPLIVAEQPNLYIIHDYSALSYSAVNSQLRKIYSSRQINKIVAIQRYHSDSEKIYKRTVLNKEFQTKELKKIRITPYTYIKISEVLLPDSKQL